MAKDNNTLLKGITAVLLAGVMVGGGVAIGYGAATDWTYKKTTVSQEQDNGNDNGGGVVADTEVHGVTLLSAKIMYDEYEAYGVSANAISAFTVTPTITNADSVSELGMSLSLSFVNPSSEWATGKVVTDYVTISKTHINSGESFVLTCNKAFGEQIQVKAVADASPTGEEIFAIQKLDFLKRASAYTNIYTYDTTSSQISAGSGTSGYLVSNEEFTDDDTMSEFLDRYTYAPTNSDENRLPKYIDAKVVQTDGTIESGISITTVSLDFVMKSGSNVTVNYTYNSTLGVYELPYDTDSEMWSELFSLSGNKTIKEYIAENMYGIQIKIAYNNSITKALSIKITTSDLYTYATGIEFDTDGNLVF